MDKHRSLTIKNNKGIRCSNCGSILDLKDSGLAKQFEDMARRVKDLENEIDIKNRALNDTNGVLAELEQEIKSCQELKGKIDQEVEKRIEKLLYKGFEGCGRCSKPRLSK